MIPCKRWMTLTLVCTVALIGCSQRSQSEKRFPRPVTVFRLVESTPSSSDRLAGSVVSWKTDQLGFEVAGPVMFVIEQEKDIDGNIYDEKGREVQKGTLLARLDSSRYALKVKSMEANIEAAAKRKEAAEIELKKVLPAKKKSVMAQRDLSVLDIKRYRKLYKDGAAGKRELDVAQAKFDIAVADLAGVEAQIETKKAEIESINAEINQLKQGLAEAQRNVEDCRLFAQFEGQVADVHVVPGSFVKQGQAVVTVQMMDPIKVAIEVSADTARKLNHRDIVSVYVPMPGGRLIDRKGAIWTIDAVADPATRTITVDIMLFNEKMETLLDDSSNKANATTQTIGVVVTGHKVKPSALFVNEESIHADKDGAAYLWKITNRDLSGTSDPTGELKVRKVPIKTRDLAIRFLGKYIYREFEIIGDKKLSPKDDLVAGKLEFADADKWDGETVMLKRKRWLFRPGDLVSVDISNSKSSKGFYVPLNAIAEKSGKKYIFEMANNRAKRIAIDIVGEVGTLRRIEAAGETPLRPNMRIIQEGAHYLIDGAAVTVTKEVKVQP